MENMDAEHQIVHCHYLKVGIAISDFRSSHETFMNIVIFVEKILRVFCTTSYAINSEEILCMAGTVSFCTYRCGAPTGYSKINRKRKGHDTNVARRIRGCL